MLGIDADKKKELAELFKAGLTVALKSRSFLLGLSLMRLLKRFVSAKRLKACTSHTQAKKALEESLLRSVVDKEEIDALPVFFTTVRKKPVVRVYLGYGSDSYKFCSSVQMVERTFSTFENPWYSKLAGGYIEKHFISMWGALAKSSVYLVRNGLGVHVYGSNNFVESNFSFSKSIDTTLGKKYGMWFVHEFAFIKHYYDAQAHARFAKSILKKSVNSTIAPTILNDVESPSESETSWDRSKKLSFEKLWVTEFGRKVGTALPHLVHWARSDSINGLLGQSSLVSIPSVRRFVEELKKGNVGGGSFVYNKMRDVFFKEAKSEINSDITAALDKYAQSRRTMACPGLTCQYHDFISSNTTLPLTCQLKVGESALSTSGSDRQLLFLSSHVQSWFVIVRILYVNFV